MSGFVWVLGDVAVDLTLTVARFPDEGGDAFATHRGMSIGGCGANIAIVLARLGRRPALIANVGDDEWGRLAAASLVTHGADIAAVSYDRTAPTHLTVVVVSGGGERTMIGHRGASAHAGPWPALDGQPEPPGPPGPPRPARALIVSGYALFGDERAAQARRVIEAAHQDAVPVILDLPTDLRPDVRTAVFEVLPHVRVLVAGAAEICGLTGTSDPSVAAGSLWNPGGTVVVTLGSDGCLAVGPGGQARVPGICVDPVDTTGAGDAFVAAFTAGWLGGLGVPELLALASGFGAAVTLRRGAGGAMPWPDEVLDLAGGAGHLPAGTLAWLRRASRDQRARHEPGGRR